MVGQELKIVPLELKELNALVTKLHRHHKPVQGHRFSIGVVDGLGNLIGGAAVGRPVARLTDSKRTLEITRLVTDGTPNACSFLYSAVVRIGKALGYEKVQTFILDTEPGTSLKAAGYKYEITNTGGQWKHTDGKPRRTDQPTQPKQRWAKCL